VRCRAIEERRAWRGCFIGTRSEFTTPTGPRLTADRTPTKGRLRVRRPRPLHVVVAAEGFHVDKTAQVTQVVIAVRRTVVEELVLEGLAAATAVHEEVLELGEAS
jgi:hypothetical protein